MFVGQTTISDKYVNFNQSNVGKIFSVGVQLAGTYASEKYGDQFDYIKFEGSGMLARSLDVSVNPIEYQTINIHFKDGTFRKIGEVLPEKSHLKDLKTEQEICNELKQLIDKNLLQDEQINPNRSELKIAKDNIYKTSNDIYYTTEDQMKSTEVIECMIKILKSDDMVNTFYVAEGYFGFMKWRDLAVGSDEKNLNEYMKNTHPGRRFTLKEMTVSELPNYLEQEGLTKKYDIPQKKKSDDTVSCIIL